MGSQLTVAELLGSIKKGDLILPEFQRGYVWNSTQAREYLTSLYKGYPTGSFLMWKTPNPGRVRGGVASDGFSQLILDGQQRLTTLYTLFEGEPPPFYEGETLYFNIHFNVRTEEFSGYKASAMSGVAEWLPVTPFLRIGIGEYLKSGGPISGETRAFLFDHFDKLQRLDAIRSYSYYLDTLAERQMDEVVSIFNLVNSGGTRLTKNDLALSHVCSLWPEARAEMRNTREDFEKQGFNFDLAFFVRCLSSVATNSGSFEPLYRVDVAEVRTAWTRTKSALEYLLNVLRSHAYIDSDNAIVSDYALVPLIVYLANGTKTFKSASERNEFLHWMYAAMLWSRYAGSSETKLNQDIQALSDPEPARRLRDAIVAERGRIKVEARDLVGVSTRSAFSMMAYVVARAAGAVDWGNGNKLYNDALGQRSGLEYHHVFPQSKLYEPAGPFNSKVPGDVHRVNEIANIAYLTSAANKDISNKLPVDYLAGIRSAYPGALAAQCVPENPALWEIDRFEDFLAERRERLAAAMNAYLGRLLEGDAEQQSFTVADYIAAGESETVEFKMSLRWDHRDAKVNKVIEKVVGRTLAGFMNAKGGTLVIGVADDGSVCGLDADLASLPRHDLDGWEQAFRSSMNEYLGKDVCALIEASFSEVDGRQVAVLRADPQVKPVFLSDGGKAEFHVRSGNTTQLLDVKQSTAYILQRFPAIT